MSSFIFIKLPFLTTRKEKTIRCLYDSLLFLIMYAQSLQTRIFIFLCIARQTFNAERQGYAKLRIVCTNGLFIIQHLPDVSHFLVFLPLRDRPACVCFCVRVRVRACMYSFHVLNQLIDFHETSCERYALGGHLKAVIFVLLDSNNMADARKCEAVANLVSLILEPEVICDNMSRKNYATLPSSIFVEPTLPT